MNCHQLTFIEGDWRTSSERIEFVIINKHSGRSDRGSRNCKFFSTNLLPSHWNTGLPDSCNMSALGCFQLSAQNSILLLLSISLIVTFTITISITISISNNNTLCLPTAKTSYYLQEYILNFFCVDHFSVTFGIESRFFEVQTQTNFTFTALSPTSLCQNTTLWKRTPAFQLYSPLEL